MRRIHDLNYNNVLAQLCDKIGLHDADTRERSSKVLQYYDTA